ncbi:unnamed protein product [Linum trigynum]|uniref:Uncharacterized protein n=1 Tax=Linum trigynum TaxID=586398 RepID=A0AAV2GAA4_9ROSI
MSGEGDLPRLMMEAGDLRRLSGEGDLSGELVVAQIDDGGQGLAEIVRDFTVELVAVEEDGVVAFVEEGIGD